VLDLEALAATTLNTAPYEWALQENALDPQRAPALIDTFPTDDFWQLGGDDGEKTYTYAARPLIILGADRTANLSPLSAAWQEMAADLLSPDYRAALAEATGRDLSGAVMEAALWRWNDEAHLGPHLDMREKILTQVIYLNGGWNPWWGGCLRILGSRDDDDLVSEIPPLLGSASILVRAENSWHSVSAVSGAPVPRRSLIITWLYAGNESATWWEDGDGVVGTHADPPGAVREETPATSGFASLEAYAAQANARCAQLDARIARLEAGHQRKAVRAGYAVAREIDAVRKQPLLRKITDRAR
jgi:hypothetical protein